MYQNFWINIPQALRNLTRVMTTGHCTALEAGYILHTTKFTLHIQFYTLSTVYCTHIIAPLTLNIAHSPLGGGHCPVYFWQSCQSSAGTVARTCQDHCCCPNTASYHGTARRNGPQAGPYSSYWELVKEFTPKKFWVNVWPKTNT